jgi:hypothetical protein
MQSGPGQTLVIVAYKPKPGRKSCSSSLANMFREKKGATDRPVIAAQAKEGTVVEAFEWAEGGVEKAHTNPVVQKLWERCAAACEIVPLNQLAESSTVFASFTPLDVS